MVGQEHSIPTANMNRSMSTGSVARCNAGELAGRPVIGRCLRWRRGSSCDTYTENREEWGTAKARRREGKHEGKRKHCFTFVAALRVFAPSRFNPDVVSRKAAVPPSASGAC